jgi:hypothetical protein
MIIAPYFCPAATGKVTISTSLRVLQAVSARSTRCFCGLPPCSCSAFQTATLRQIPISIPSAKYSSLCYWPRNSWYPTSWEDGRTGQTHGVQQLSYPSIQLHRNATPACTFHTPFSSFLDRIGKPSDYAYLQSASSEGLIISHATPFFSLPFSFSYFRHPAGLAACRAQSERLRLVPSFSVVALCLIACCCRAA